MIAIARNIVAAGVPLVVCCACGPALAADLAVDCQKVAAQGFFPVSYKEIGQADVAGVGDVFSFSDGRCLCQASFEDVPRTRREASALAKTNPALVSSLYCEVN
ncbi:MULTISPECIES: hypothetical protein [unclassified Devosia]|uniref:hypothetical protein n=1 Tax=unclassified Devosia TaxID=196773 RepID=UPI001AC65BB4|nr:MULTISPECIES: hypothetical protein [unclassified Devosia]MBN9304274.1 hypothetical protein [Devosia sp.]